MAFFEVFVVGVKPLMTSAFIDYGEAGPGRAWHGMARRGRAGQGRDFSI